MHLQATEAPIRIREAQEKDIEPQQGTTRSLAKQRGPTGEGLAAASVKAAEWVVELHELACVNTNM